MKNILYQILDSVGHFFLSTILLCIKAFLQLFFTFLALCFLAIGFVFGFISNFLRILKETLR